MLNFVAKFFPAAKTCQKCGHGPDSIFSMPDMAMPVSFADNTFWSIKRTGDCSPALSISYAFFLLLTFLSASSACKDDSQSGSREDKQERDPVIRLVASTWQLVPVTV